MVEVNSPHQIVEITVNGGSGYGDPARRDPEALARDMRLGMVTPEGAARDYGAAKTTVTA